ncbi:hypothetical protein DFH09DRAFT_1401947 [Mycena vulgaris]|nr:hypothetical protein DFH09DRAFT_1401947 [Mycena vulgaris]
MSWRRAAVYSRPFEVVLLGVRNPGSAINSAVNANGRRGNYVLDAGYRRVWVRAELTVTQFSFAHGGNYRDCVGESGTILVPKRKQSRLSCAWYPIPTFLRPTQGDHSCSTWRLRSPRPKIEELSNQCTDSVLTQTPSATAVDAQEDGGRMRDEIVLLRGRIQELEAQTRSPWALSLSATVVVPYIQYYSYNTRSNGDKMAAVRVPKTGRIRTHSNNDPGVKSASHWVRHWAVNGEQDVELTGTISNKVQPCAGRQRDRVTGKNELGQGNTPRLTLDDRHNRTENIKFRQIEEQNALRGSRREPVCSACKDIGGLHCHLTIDPSVQFQRNECLGPRPEIRPIVCTKLPFPGEVEAHDRHKTRVFSESLALVSDLHTRRIFLEVDDDDEMLEFLARLHDACRDIEEALRMEAKMREIWNE